MLYLITYFVMLYKKFEKDVHKIIGQKLIILKCSGAHIVAEWKLIIKINRRKQD